MIVSIESSYLTLKLRSITIIFIIGLKDPSDIGPHSIINLIFLIRN